MIREFSVHSAVNYRYNLYYEYPAEYLSVPYRSGNTDVLYIVQGVILCVGFMLWLQKNRLLDDMH